MYRRICLVLIGFFMAIPAMSLAADPAPAAAPAVATTTAAQPAQPSGDKKYIEVTQGDLSSGRENYDSKDVVLTGQFLFTGSDFCYQIRKTKINTRDYLCFALGPVSLVRLYLKKDHPQVEELLKVKKGVTLKAYGNFDSIGNDYKYLVVDRFEVVK